MTNIDIKKLSIEDLVNYYKATKELCQRYEKSIKNYDGSINTDGETYRKYDKFSKTYLKLLEEMEARVSEL